MKTKLLALWIAMFIAATATRGDDDVTIFTLAGTGPGSDDGVGSAARFFHPQGLAVDGAGNTYVADSENHTIRKISPTGAVTTLAGLAATPGIADGTGSAARFFYPAGMLMDGAGNLLVADQYNHTIRKITPAGVVTTWAGQPQVFGSTDGFRTNALFYLPKGLARDLSGNVYVADTYNNTIRKITSAGVVTTLAGLAGSFGGTNGTGSAARFRLPSGVAADAAGNVYVADTGNEAIRKITPAGVVTTWAGPPVNADGSAPDSGFADGLGVEARFYDPSDVAVDFTGNVYVADLNNNAIRKISPAGLVSTWAGRGFGTNDGPDFYNPAFLAVDSGGNVLVSDYNNNAVRKISTNQTVTLLAGRASAGSADGIGTVAQFFSPYGIAVDAAGNVFVGDSWNQTVRKITPAGVVSTWAGKAGDYGNADGPGNVARFQNTGGLALDRAGNLYVPDYYTIRKITPDGVVSTLAGTNGPGSTDGIGAAAGFRFPSGVAVDSSTNVYVADTENHTIRKITPDGQVTTFAGLAETSGSADGIGSQARFLDPQSVALDSAQNLYVADENNHTIRKITPAGVVTTFAGTAGNSGNADGAGSAAQFNYPSGVVVDHANNVYVADLGNSLIRKITPAGIVTTWAGRRGIYGSTQGLTDGGASVARFFNPAAVALDGADNLYIADTRNNTIRRSTPSADLHPSRDRDQEPVLLKIRRQLSVSNAPASVTANWSLIRQPTGSTNALSSMTIANPTFTPDTTDLYQFRLTATDTATGHRSIETLDLSVQDYFLIQSNANVTVAFYGIPGVGYHVQASTNLRTNGWTDLGVVTTAPNNEVRLTEPGVSSAYRFYRIVP